MSRAPVSIVCVFNDPDVLEQCLVHSVEALRHEAPDTELITVDNTGHAFPTAAAALNHGAGRARHDILVFVHQDVWLHSLTVLERLGALMETRSELGIVGAVGVDSAGAVIGWMRDRVALIGRSVDEPTDVESLDEVLFVIHRRVLTEEPLAERTELAWHAYGVEYGLRMKSRGLRVTAVDIPLTHNSLSINLDRLDVAHRHVGDTYPQLLPVHTTCGVIRPRHRSLPGSAVLAPHRWRYRWLRDSLRSREVGRRFPGEFALVDVRMEIDDVLERIDMLAVVNHSGDMPFADAGNEPLELRRRGHRLTVESATTKELGDTVAARAATSSVLVTNLDAGSLTSLQPLIGTQQHLAGYHEGDYWLLLGPAVDAVPQSWRSGRARPLRG